MAIMAGISNKPKRSFMNRYVFAGLALAALSGCATLQYEKLPESEHKRYFELAAVAGRDEADRYAAIPDPADRDRHWLKFWKEKDPTPTTPENERYEEHLRRVAFADRNFPASVFYWDDRGKIYIKYGDPDQREWNPLGQSTWRLDGSGPDSRGTSHRRGILGRSASGTDSTGTGSPDDFSKQANKPLDTYAWEHWTYHRLGRELYFTERATGFQLTKDLDAAANPMADRTAASLRAVEISLTDLPPELAGDDYQHDYGQPLDFPFGCCRFADSSGAEVWVYYAVPLGDITFNDSTSCGAVTRTIVISDAGLNEVERSEQLLSPPRLAGADRSGAQAADVQRFTLGVGTYQLAISLMDMNSGKTGAYKCPLTVVDYQKGAEETSDLLLSGDIRLAQGESKFAKGKYWVVPQAGNVFKTGASLYLYYELYNLKRGPNGHYRADVTYSLLSRKGRQAVRADPVAIDSNVPTVVQATGLPLAGLGQGDYVALVEILDPASGKIRKLARSFKIMQ
jgi:GWxTD domain-containing protein